MKISQADEPDLPSLAQLLWLCTLESGPVSGSLEEFEAQLGVWWRAHRDTHFAFVARVGEPTIVGMAWVALAPRVPRPGATERISGDVQSVFVVPEARGQGVGAALVEAASAHAEGAGAARVTVHSGRQSVSLYQRLGFSSSPQLLQRPSA
jgi:GNAT superfamily N-acetyltransferase